ncbi:hypothetical protein A2524_02160 [Candidatus Wolfebacteria bacterium RIFOXYD12_FULL_48_21]|uniref:Type II secretion system protein GspG C-terminal domain-containing protein n=1 Tax=Candidatus Wolfebacteria bacterium RIFOXYD1_FULL_48_65 TaxID=1802561 RepID=A0A1F8E4H3_9BACT|nr:MAG: hypothetical protein A2524_02160 [Candidatus Wolfebacteria bacterium RIFOXYD12_FULL_48_21]OGM95527.1 MAG: hypothetical protein A2610_01955 [Candidatus Wolfebacteria bacterium RIFOXYD1_FULL_48_65]
MNKSQKGFTLLELLIVIAILAVLATVAVLVINPVEYLRQARDSQRVGDLASVKGAIDLYLTTATTPDLTVGVSGNAARCMVGIVSPFTLACTTNATRTVDGAGWVLVNLASLSGGSPLATLPQDPTNDATHFYAYAAAESTNTYELNAKMESVKFGTDQDLDGKDGGNQATWYEIGNDPALDL